MELTVDGLKTHYSCTGEGQTVVLIHGWGANIQVYAGIIGCLAAKYRVIALDLPGFGESDEPPEPWDVDHYVDFVLHFLSEFQLDHVILMGHSFGCRIIIKMMAQRQPPFAVDKLIICDGAGIKPPQSLKKQARTRLFKAGKAVCNIPLVKKLAPEALEQWRGRFGSADYNSATPVMRASLVKVVNEDLSDLLGAVKPEALLIWGENDTATPLSDGQTMERKMPNAGLAVIKNAGHFSFLDQPYVFRSILASYLGL